MERKGFIGGSDIGVILGLSQYKTPLQLWAEKTGMIEPDDISDKLQVALGVELEDFVARRFTKETGKEVIKTSSNIGDDHFTHKDYDWAKCQVDRFIVGTDELLECKTTSAFTEDWKGEEIPAYYRTQVQWQLMITGRSVGWIAVLIGNHKFLYKEIKADKEVQDILLSEAKKFWDLVQNETKPPACLGDDNTLLRLYPKNNDNLQALQEMEAAIAQRQALKEQVDALEKEIKEIEIKLKEVIGENSGIVTDKYVVTWNAYETSRVDSDLLKKDGVYDKYAKKISSRRLLVKLNKNS